LETSCLHCGSPDLELVKSFDGLVIYFVLLARRLVDTQNVVLTIHVFECLFGAFLQTCVCTVIASPIDML
jgi:hypothetical protein